MRSEVFGVVGIIALLVSPAAIAQETSTGAGPDCAEEMQAGKTDPDMGTLMACLVRMQSTIESLQSEDAQPGTSIPEGAVVAFDRTTGCPTGWERFDPASGRMIVGVKAGIKASASDNKNVFTPTFREFGGNHHIRIDTANLPSHTHPLDIAVRDKYISRVESDKISDETPTEADADFQGGSWSKWFFSGEGGDPNFTLGARYRWAIDTHRFPESGAKGAGEPLWNMPPYVVLFMCRKS